MAGEAGRPVRWATKMDLFLHNYPRAFNGATAKRVQTGTRVIGLTNVVMLPLSSRFGHGARSLGRIDLVHQGAGVVMEEKLVVVVATGPRVERTGHRGGGQGMSKSTLWRTKSWCWVAPWEVKLEDALSCESWMW